MLQHLMAIQQSTSLKGSIFCVLMLNPHHLSRIIFSPPLQKQEKLCYNIAGKTFTLEK